MLAPKRLSSGRYVDLSNITAKDIDIEDIVKPLNLIYRFTGHWKDKKPLTVAQHTLLTYNIAVELFPDEPDVHLDCIIHDWGEAYYGDIATPLKQILKPEQVKSIKAIDQSIFEIFWEHSLDYTQETYQKRKMCDMISLDIERRNMWQNQRGKALWPQPPKSKITNLSLEDKQEIFDEMQAIAFVDLEALYWEQIDKCRMTLPY
jgi:hypothetical protein